ncbi:hypothetical protein GGR23_001918 [Gellertiella hungarica]|uniref:Uncharacterized protein n=1 Tax=Gellertiella hungarica TaxID=1572859 RepID=A0A7W6J6B9_9HYPH|nr:hypothetical protein [Gellertiella hungarica]
MVTEVRSLRVDAQLNDQYTAAAKKSRCAGASRR